MDDTTLITLGIMAIIMLIIYWSIVFTFFKAIIRDGIYEALDMAGLTKDDNQDKEAKHPCNDELENW